MEQVKKWLLNNQDMVLLVLVFAVLFAAILFFSKIELQ